MKSPDVDQRRNGQRRGALISLFWPCPVRAVADMNVIKEIQRINAKELQMGTSLDSAMKGSWHDQYRGSAYVFVGGLPYDLTEGDIICVFSRSTVLAVDNFTGAKLLGRTLRVDHVAKYRPKKDDNEKESKKEGGRKPRDEFERLKEEWQHDMHEKEQDRGAKRPRDQTPPHSDADRSLRDGRYSRSEETSKMDDGREGRRDQPQLERRVERRDDNRDDRHRRDRDERREDHKHRSSRDGYHRDTKK
jgi:RNA-binding motif protein, X-linked 2